MPHKHSRDVEKIYSVKQFVRKLRRLARAMETRSGFRIQVAGKRIRVPANASMSVEHERSGASEEVEFQLKWHRGKKR
ncbi:MAG TPA: amphi-Trp domain-containing protein [Bacteroidota bacterium]|nr:amphi-Trp domain-containing protein [Bacteroidota bacterium]